MVMVKSNPNSPNSNLLKIPSHVPLTLNKNNQIHPEGPPIDLLKKNTATMPIGVILTGIQSHLEHQNP